MTKPESLTGGCLRALIFHKCRYGGIGRLGDLGSPAKSVRVRVPLPAPGSNPFELGVGRRMLLTIRRSAFPYAEVAQLERAEE